ncbi:MAG: HEPN domain-containing protein [Planctomycetaceae bacterium]|jgi:HEPN domain-containing protein|nr:HEPN domain-containing protein [Planctomycetaceae bacterium]
MSKYHNVWIFKAENDLQSANILIQQNPPLLDVAVFHTQQCAEKALKGFLSFRRQEIRKTHNPAELIRKCAALDSSFETLLADGDFLTPQATEFRYPGTDDDGDEIADFSEFMPAFDDVQESVSKASAVLEFVKSKTVT